MPLCLFWGPVHPQTLWRTLTPTVSCPQSCPRAPLAPPVPRPSGRVGSELRSALGHGHTGRPAVLWCLLQTAVKPLRRSALPGQAVGISVNKRKGQVMAVRARARARAVGLWEALAQQGVRPSCRRDTQKRPQGDAELLGREVGKALFFFFNEVAYSVPTWG